jgi:hypothetical protein
MKTPRPRTVLSDAEPLTAEEREACAREWLERTIASLTPAQRGQMRALAKRKLEPRGPQGRPKRWTVAAKRQLLADYETLRRSGLSAATSKELLSKWRGTSKIEKYLADARKLPPQ